MFRAILHWFLTHGLMIMFAAGGAALPSAGSGEAGSGSGGGTGMGTGTGSGGSGGSPSPSGAQPGSPSGTGGTGTGTPTPTPGQGQGSVDWATAPAHFRTAYEAQQAELARWKGLGVEHDIATTYVQNTRQMIGEAYQIGRQLRYSDQDIQEALSKDLVGTLSFLRQAAARQPGQGQGQGHGQGQRQGQGQIDPSIKRLLDERLSPIEEHTNAAMADAANQAFTGEFNRLFTDHYKAEAQSYPEEYRELLFDAVSEVFKYNDKGMHSLKFARDTSAVAETFRTVEARFAQAFNAYHMYQLGKSGQQSQRPGQPGVQQAGGNNNKNGWEGLTLDDIATGDDRAVKLIPSMR